MYDVRIEETQAYLRFEVRGRADPDDASALIREVARHTLERGCERVLLVFRSSGALSASALYEIFGEPRRLGLRAATCIAMVQEDRTALQRARFAANVLQNRGIRCDAFASLADAETWLVAQ